MYIDLHEPCYLKRGEAVTPFLPMEYTMDLSGRITIEGRQLSLSYLANLPKSRDRATTIERVIFNNPATIVIWSDKTKTVVKCQPGDTYDPEKGLALCISKKFFGNKGNFNEVFKKWITEAVEDDDEIKVGSEVVVTRAGLHYSTYNKWVETIVKSEEHRRKWGKDKGEFDVQNGQIGRVLYIAEHLASYDNSMLAYVDFGEHCAIIGIEGLKKIK